MPLNRFAFSVLKHLPRVKCVSFVGVALAVKGVQATSYEKRDAS
jgi:hypothetical protein